MAMRGIAVVLVVTAVLAGAAHGELQNVEVGGFIGITGNYYSCEAVNGWTGTGHNLSFVEQRTKVHVQADFSDQVTAFIELDSYDVWGETPISGAAANEFRSAYITGADARANTSDDVEIYQAFVQLDEMFGLPVRARIGRQEIMLGNEWLVGNNDGPVVGLSFDAIRLTYASEVLTVDAFWSKLAERSPIEEDGDVDLYGIYGTYSGLANVEIDAYWLLVRDAIDRNTDSGPLGEIVEQIFGLDEYSVTNLNTVGMRVNGAIGQVDFEAETAYQFGNASSVGVFYGDDELNFDEWAFTTDIGYTFDVQYQPRVFVGFTWFDGEDNRTPSYFEWLNLQLNPWAEPKASLGFNRLFSDVAYSEYLDNTLTDMSNLWTVRVGASAILTEKVEVEAALSYFEAVDGGSYGRFGWNNAFELPFFTVDSDEDLGFESALAVSYAYSDDLTFSAGWNHLFAGDGLNDPNWVLSNGLADVQGADTDDADYLWTAVEITF